MPVNKIQLNDVRGKDIYDIVERDDVSRTPVHNVTVSFRTLKHGDAERHTGTLLDISMSRGGNEERWSWILTVRLSDGNVAKIYQRWDAEEDARVIFVKPWGGLSTGPGKIYVDRLTAEVDRDSPPICPVCNDEMFHAMTEWSAYAKANNVSEDPGYNGLICEECFPDRASWERGCW